MIRQVIESVAAATRNRDRDSLDVALVDLLSELVDPDRVTIYRVGSDGGEQRVYRRLTITRGGLLEHADGEEPSRRLCDVESWQDCALRSDAAHWREVAEDGTPRLFSVYPVFGENELLRLIEIEFDESRSGLSARDARLIGAVLRIIANHLSLLDYGERDTLTGLMNRRTFEATFGKARDRSRALACEPARSAPSWLGIVDIDRFKTINDRFGHLFGDEVLLLIARRLRETFRGAEQLFRFGGEEFSVILDRSPEAGAAAAFERLRAAIEGHVFPQVGSVTVSIGYTRILPAEAASSAFERADAALYFAKNHGRNQVRSHEHLLAAGELQLMVTASDVELF